MSNWTRVGPYIRERYRGDYEVLISDRSLCAWRGCLGAYFSFSEEGKEQSGCGYRRSIMSSRGALDMILEKVPGLHGPCMHASRSLQQRISVSDACTMSGADPTEAALASSRVLTASLGSRSTHRRYAPQPPP